jgi:hypothetical protein
MTQQTTQLNYPQQISEIKTSCLYNRLPYDLLERLRDKVEIDELRKENESLKRSVNYLGDFVELFKAGMFVTYSTSPAICCKCGSRNERPWLGDTDVTYCGKKIPAFLICGSKRYCGSDWASDHIEEDEMYATFIEDGEEICTGLREAICDPECDLKCNHWVCSQCVHVQRINRCTWTGCTICNKST